MKRLLALAIVLLSVVPAFAQVQPSGVGPQSVITPPIFGLPASAVSGSGGVSTSLIPTVDNSFDLGSSSFRWRNLYIGTQVLCADGAVGAPCFSFASDSDNGLYFVSANTWGLSAAGAQQLQIENGAVRVASASLLAFGSDVSLSRGAADRLDLATGDSFNLVGGGGSLRVANVVAISSTAPTVTSAGSSPSVSGSNTAAFRVNVGTGGTASAIVMSMPTATTGWNCRAENLTATAANRANQRVVQQSSTTTSVTVQNQTISTGAALAFTASDIVAFMCIAY